MYERKLNIKIPIKIYFFFFFYSTYAVCVNTAKMANKNEKDKNVPKDAQTNVMPFSFIMITLQLKCTASHNMI